MKPKLPDSLYSVDQLLAVAEELHRYGAGLAQRRHHGPAVAPETPSPVASELLEQLPPAKRDQDEAIEGLRRQLEQLATTAPTVTLVLAAPAPSKLKQELVNWLRTNVRPHVLVNFHVNPEIAGGVVIRSTNRIFDCSFRTKLLNEPERFTRVLDRV